MPANLRITETANTQTSDERVCEPLIPGQLGREALESAARIHAAFLKSAAVALSELIQTPVSMTFREATQAPFSRVFSDIRPEDHVIALDLAPLRGFGFLTFPTLLLFRILDILLATSENMPEEIAPDVSRRTVTGIELHILREFFDVFTHSLRDTWAPFHPVAFSQISADEKSEPCMTEYGDDLALNLRATMDVSGLTADIHLVVPPFLVRLAGSSSAPASQPTVSKPVRGDLLNCLGGATVWMDAVLDGTNIRIRNLLDLLPGQILVLGSSEGSSVHCRVNSHPRFSGELIASNGRYAIQIDTLNGAPPPVSAESQFTDAAETDK
jgi:flagellar motor switch protein FliM